MIIVRVELRSAITGKRTELARMMIANEGHEGDFADYSGKTYFGRNSQTLDKSMERGKVVRTGEVKNHRRWAMHVWHLVAKMLNDMEYGK